MKWNDFASPGTTNGISLMQECSKAISAAQTSASLGTREQLLAFFKDCVKRTEATVKDAKARE